MPYADRSIESRLLQNDPEALGRVIRWISAVLTWPRFWSLRTEWPDLVQEALVRVVESLQKERFDDRRDFHFYVQGVARHTALRALQDAARRPGKEHLSSVGAAQLSTQPPPVEAAANRQLLRRVMDLASEECRLLMRAYYLEEQSYEKISTDLDWPIGTVKSRLFRCLEGAQKALRIVVRRRNDDAE